MQNRIIILFVLGLFILTTYSIPHDVLAHHLGPIGSFHIEVPCNNSSNCTPLPNLIAFDLDGQSYGITSDSNVDMRTGVYPEVPLPNGNPFKDFLGFQKLVGLNGATLYNLGVGITPSCINTNAINLTPIISTSDPNIPNSYPSGLHYVVLTGDGNLFLLTLIRIDATAPNGLEMNYSSIEACPDGIFPPIAYDDLISTNEDTPYDGNVIATDAESDSLTYSIANSPSNGTLDFNSDGTFTYTPNENYNGADSFTFKANDGELDSNIATISINVIPVNDPPVCSDPTSSTSTIWPPNHKMVKIDFGMLTSDVDGDLTTLYISSIFQDEPTNGLGDGDQSPDASIADGTVRAERSGLGDGRVYTITVTADDGNGGSCAGSFSVGVPHDQSGIMAYNDGQSFDSTQP